MCDSMLHCLPRECEGGTRCRESFVTPKSFVATKQPNWRSSARGFIQIGIVMVKSNHQNVNNSHIAVLTTHLGKSNFNCQTWGSSSRLLCCNPRRPSSPVQLAAQQRPRRRLRPQHQDHHRRLLQPHQHISPHRGPRCHLHLLSFK